MKSSDVWQVEFLSPEEPLIILRIAFRIKYLCVVTEQEDTEITETYNFHTFFIHILFRMYSYFS